MPVLQGKHGLKASTPFRSLTLSLLHVSYIIAKDGDNATCRVRKRMIFGIDDIDEE